MDIVGNTGAPAGRRAEWADLALAEAQPSVFWLDDPARPPARDSLVGDTDTDLLIVGGGYTGLWAALEAKRRDPDRDVLLVGAGRVGDGGSGRNGGFCSSSLTHGLANGIARFGSDIDDIVRLGHDNFEGLCADVAALGIDCQLRRVGEVDVATRPHLRLSLSWQDFGLPTGGAGSSTPAHGSR